jgi:CMP-N-acetylneuraminic acid synthetase
MSEFQPTTAVIIARGGSARLPNKNLLPFNGRTLVAHKVWQLRQTKLIDTVVVGSDSDDILREAACEGAMTIKREPEFCDEKSRSWNEVIVNMVEQVEGHAIVWAHCTNPCIRPSTYDRAVRCFQATDGDSVVGVTPFRNHIWWNGRPLNFDPYKYPHAVAAHLPPIYFQNGGIFIASRELMLRTHYVYGQTPEMFVISEEEAIDVDTQEDLDRAVALYPLVSQ